MYKTYTMQFMAPVNDVAHKHDVTRALPRSTEIIFEEALVLNGGNKMTTQSQYETSTSTHVDLYPESIIVKHGI